MRICLLMTLLLTGCSALTGNPGAHWRSASIQGFTFSLPAGFEQAASQGPSSGITQYTNADMTITCDEGASSGEPLDSLANYGNYTSQLVIIHSYPVQIVSFDIPPGPGHRFDYATAASFRALGLTMYVHCKTRDDYSIAMQIFKTVKPKPFRSRAPQQ